jgi:glyoxylase I family protein
MTISALGLVPLLQVFDMPRSVAFYCGALGFSAVDASPEVDAPEGRFSHWMWLRLGGADLMLNTAHDEGERPARPEAGRSTWHGDTTLFIGCKNVDAAYETLRAHLPDLGPPVTAPYGMRQLTLEDPDGYRLCFQTPV